ncbi:MAG: C-GCAxxG-C-C family protein [Promethearchaeota archaeon]
MKKNQNIVDKTLEYWEEANCARTTVCVLLSHYGYEALCDPFFKAMLPMGGGFGDGLVCGAVTGTLAAISLILFEEGLTEEEIKEKITNWKIIFKERFKSLNCYDLMNKFLNVNGELDFDMPGRREKCTDTVTSAVTFACQILDSIKLKN